MRGGKPNVLLLSALRSEMEEQVLGEVGGDHLLWIGQCHAAQVSDRFIQQHQPHNESIKHELYNLTDTVQLRAPKLATPRTKLFP